MRTTIHHCRSLTWLLLTCLLATGCRQQMAKQPAYRPLQASTFFEDGRASRPLVEGTVPRGNLQADTHFYQGKRTATNAEKLATAVGNLGSKSPWTILALHSYGSVFEETFPFPVTSEVLKRGQERYDIQCAVCHGRVGDGNGMIPQRGFTKPPSYHTDLSRGFKLRGIELKLRDAPVGYYFEVVTNGYGAMPSLAAQVTPEDRWAIIAYIRVLQYSQSARYTAKEKKT